MLMHEAMVAQSLLTAIATEAAKEKAKPISASLSCGELHAVNDEVLRFAFEAIAKGTPCENVKLKIQHKPIQGKCKSCSQVFSIDTELLKCPSCGDGEFELLPDSPLLLEEIEFETE
jgi:hydrogenase nickel incorporation protein HypA/HybF